MWVLLAGLAHAGIRSDLYALAADGPSVGVACSSMSGAIAQVERFADTMEGEIPLPVAAIFKGRLGDLLRENDGPFRLAIWTDTRVVRLDMDTTETAEALAHQLAASSGGVAVPEALAWSVRTAGGTAFHLKVDAGRMTLSNAVDSPTGNGIVPRAVVDALPETDGCAVLFHGPAAELGPIDLGVHFPFTTPAPMHFVIGSEKLHALDGVVFHPRAPAEVRTEAVPEAVVVLGVGLDGVNFSRFLNGKGLARARRLQRKLPVTAGTTFAVLHTTPTMAFGMSLPMARQIPAQRLARRTRRIFEALDMPVVSRDDAHFSTEAGADHLELAAQAGRLLLASDAPTLAAMEAGRGEPWVTGTASRLAGEYPFVVVTGVVPNGRGKGTYRLDEPALLALALEPGLLRGELTMPLTLAQLSGLMESVKEAPKGLLKGRGRAEDPRSEEPSHDDSEDPSHDDQGFPIDE